MGASKKMDMFYFERLVWGKRGKMTHAAMHFARNVRFSPKLVWGLTSAWQAAVLSRLGITVECLR